MIDAKSAVEENRFNGCIQRIQQLRERSLLLVYSSKFIVDLQVYSNHKQQSLSAHSTVKSAECTHCLRRMMVKRS